MVTDELYRGASTLPELLLGLGLCLGLAATVTDGIKKGVGRPRPNYFALRAAMDYSGGRLSSLKVRPLLTRACSWQLRQLVKTGSERTISVQQNRARVSNNLSRSSTRSFIL